MVQITGWKDCEKHYCPCNGRCHTEANPCSFDCVAHHEVIMLDVAKTQTQSSCPACGEIIFEGETVCYDKDKREYHSLCYVQTSKSKTSSLEGSK